MGKKLELKNGIPTAIDSASQEPVLSRGVLNPSGLSPSKGDRYLIYGTGAGAWSGQTMNISTYDGAQWIYTTPTEGMSVYIIDEGITLYNLLQ